MIDAPLALAFTAGLVATLNPCGFAMLPAYLSWYLGTETIRSTVGLGDRLGGALTVGALVSGGFVVVFGITGTLVTVGVRSFVGYVPWLALLIGLALVALGVALLLGRHLNVAVPTLEPGHRSHQARSMFAFGASYAIASLSCTLPVFLSVVASTFTRTNVASGIAVFVAYALGMSLMLLTVTVALAVTQQSLLGRLRWLSRRINRVAGGLLVLAGGYIAYYWAFNLSTEPGETSGAGPARFVEGLSADANAWIQDMGWLTVLVVTGLVVAAAIVTWRLGHPTTASGASCCGPDTETVDDPTSPDGTRVDPHRVAPR